MDLISLLITIVILGLVFFLLHWLIAQMPLAEPFKTVAVVILALAAVVILLGLLFGGVNVPVFRWR